MLNKRFQMVWRRPLLLAEEFIGKDSVALVLGDNIFFDLIWMNCYVLIKT
jgi:UTP-glucose-1-phosphate uridylyltransferase